LLPICNLCRYILENLSPEQYASFDARLVALSGGAVGLQKLMKAMRGEDGFKTLAEYINSPHFRGAVAESQTPEKGKDWMHPGDYLLPVSVHSIPVGDCDAMLEDLVKSEQRFSFAEALTPPDNIWTNSLFFLFVAGLVEMFPTAVAYSQLDP
jgi:hypothetical protein